MKKLSLLLSVAAASSLMAANIDVYGQAHLSADSVDNGKNATGTIASNSSRLGVKASHDLDNGITAIAQYEMGVDLSGRGNDDGNGGDFKTGQNGFFTSARTSYVGVTGDFGTVVAGNIDAQNQWIYDYNLFADQVGDVGNLLGVGGVGPDRASGTVAYISPTMNGFTGVLAYMAPGTNKGSNATAKGDPSALVAKLNYDSGMGIKAGVGYIGVALDSNVTTEEDPNEVALSLSYTNDMFSIGGGYALMRSPDKAQGVDRTVTHVGASVTPMKALTLKAQYALLDDDASNSDANMIAVGIDYAVADNFTTYVAYSATCNDTAVKYKANNWGHGQSELGAPANGEDPSAASFGIVYKFGGTVYQN